MRAIRLYLVPAAALVVALACTRAVKPSIPQTFNFTPKERVELALRVKDKEVILTGKEEAVVTTNKGTFTFKLYSNETPNTVRNFIRLADAGFYNGLIWHRYEPGFVIQGGDPLGTGYGNAGYTIDFEDADTRHEKGSVGMARGQAKNSASCQFYVCLEAQKSLDGDYVVFGKVEDPRDMIVVRLLRAGDTIESIVIKR
jgi:peptidyl-prolyl cis-trans isomerase B (cyclophilin B)